MNDAVIIAGGGPAGLMLAGELGLAGIPTIVVERRAERVNNSAGALLHARVVEILQQRGIADRFFTDKTPRWNRTHFGLMTIDLTDELGETEYDLLVPQWRTEQLLEEWAREQGADLRTGEEVIDLVRGEVDVTVRTRNLATGAEQELRGAYLIGCDGATSAVARLAGFDFEEFAPSFYGINADVVAFEGNRDQFRSGLYPDGQLGILPLQQDRMRIMTVEFVGKPEGWDTPVTGAEVRASVRRITGMEPDMDEPTWMERYGYATQLATQYRRGRVLLAGDAAHAHPPSSGNGMVTSLHDAVNLGWKLAATMHGRAPQSLLDTYEQERRPIGRRACVRAQAQVAIMHPLEHVKALREVFEGLMAFTDVRRYLVQYVTEVRYPGGDHPLIGAHCPQAYATTMDGTVALLTALNSGRGVLLDCTDGGTAIAALADYSDRLVPLAAEPVPGLDARVLLVRPDGFVAWADAAGTDLEGLTDAARRWFG